jgi:hypothetical protein
MFFPWLPGENFLPSYLKDIFFFLTWRIFLLSYLEDISLWLPGYLEDILSSVTWRISIPSLKDIFSYLGDIFYLVTWRKFSPWLLKGQFSFVT